MDSPEKDQLVQDELIPKITPSDASINRSAGISQRSKPSFSEVWPQVLASTISLSCVLQAGVNLSFSGVLIPQLSQDSHLKDNFTKVEASWIASLAVISQPFGAFAAGPLMDTFGRRVVCILQGLPMVATWLITYLTHERLWPLYLARVLSGFGSGLTLAGLVYTAEISHVSYRAMLLSMNSVHVALGILITTVVGVYLDWHTCALVFGFLALASVLASLTLQESPYWLASFTDTPQDAIRLIVRKLNKNNQSFTAEWGRIQEAISKRRLQNEAPGQAEINSTWCGKFADTFLSFRQRSAWLPFLILLLLFLLQQASGTYVVIFYTVNIFQSVGGNLGFGFDAYSATVALGVLRFVLSLVAVGLSRVLGRRPIMLLSAIGMALSAGAAGVFTHINGVDTINFNMSSNGTRNVSSLLTEGIEGSDAMGSISNIWIMVAILVYVAAGSIGLMVIPWTLISELLPIRVRAFGSGLMISYSYILLFVIIKTFPFFVDLVTFPMVLGVYAIMSGVCAVFVYFFLPETFGKSLKEIEKYFEGSSSSESSGP